MSIPRPRYGHCSLRVHGTVVVWGGRDEGDRNIPISIVEAFGLYSGLFGTVHTTGTAPLALWGSAAVPIGTSVYGFGGEDDKRHCSRDLYHFDSTLMECSIVVTSNPSDGPSKKTRCGLIRRGREELVVVGGLLNFNRATNELHAIHIREGEYA